MRFPFRRKYLSARLVPVHLLALALFLLAEPRAWGFVLGVALVASGLALRAWGAGHLVKTDRLSVSGPYAHLRHPLYSGTLLIAAGFAAAAGPPGWVLLGGVVLPVFFLYYLPYKERIESARLERRYGEDYAAYRRAVPALWPTREAWRPGATPTGEGGDARWSRARYLANDEQGTLLASLVGLMLLAARPVLPF